MRKFFVALGAGAMCTAAAAQIAGPSAVKGAKSPPVVVPVVIPTGPAVLPAPVTASRTIEVLKNAGIINPTNVDVPITLGARRTYIDELTNISLVGGAIVPKRNLITLVASGREPFIPAGTLSLAWNNDPTKRYVVDCATEGGDGQELVFDFGPDVQRTRVIGGRAAVVLPAGIRTPIRLSTPGRVDLSDCTITAFSV